MKAKTEPKGPSTLVVDLGTPLYRKLQDESLRRSRRENRRVPMTEIARTAIEREIKAKRGG